MTFIWKMVFVAIVTFNSPWAATLFGTKTAESLELSQYIQKGKIIVTVFDSGLARVWDAQRGNPLFNLYEHKDLIRIFSARHLSNSQHHLGDICLEKLADFNSDYLRANRKISNLESGKYLSRIKLNDAIFKDINFSGANLTYAYISQSKLSGCNLSAANLSRASFVRAKLRDAKLVQTRLYHTEFIQTDLKRADFRGAKFNHTLFNKVILTETIFSDERFKNCKYITPEGEEKNLTKEWLLSQGAIIL